MQHLREGGDRFAIYLRSNLTLVLLPVPSSVPKNTLFAPQPLLEMLDKKRQKTGEVRNELMVKILSEGLEVQSLVQSQGQSQSAAIAAIKAIVEFLATELSTELKAARADSL